jgi:hypothetical protein
MTRMRCGTRASLAQRLFGGGAHVAEVFEAAFDGEQELQAGVFVELHGLQAGEFGEGGLEAFAGLGERALGLLGGADFRSGLATEDLDGFGEPGSVFGIERKSRGLTGVKLFRRE